MYAIETAELRKTWKRRRMSRGTSQDMARGIPSGVSSSVPRAPAHDTAQRTGLPEAEEEALRGISFTVREGEIFSLLGPNGAGKSTLIGILTTRTQYDGGSARVFGMDVARDKTRVREAIACVAQHTSIDEHLSLTENMLFQSRMYGMDKRRAAARISELIDTFGLAPHTGKRVKEYSGGIKRRLDIAMSLVSCPRILFLDEPTTGMDIESRQILWHMIEDVSRHMGTTVFLTTHYLEEAERLSDTVCIMKDGRKLAQDTPERLRETAAAAAAARNGTSSTGPGSDGITGSGSDGNPDGSHRTGGTNGEDDGELPDLNTVFLELMRTDNENLVPNGVTAQNGGKSAQDRSVSQDGKPTRGASVRREI